MNTTLTVLAVGSLGIAAYYVFESRAAKNPTNHPLPDQGGAESQSAAAAAYNSKDVPIWSESDCNYLVDTTSLKTCALWHDENATGYSKEDANLLKYNYFETCVCQDPITGQFHRQIQGDIPHELGDVIQIEMP